MQLLQLADWQAAFILKHDHLLELKIVDKDAFFVVNIQVGP